MNSRGIRDPELVELFADDPASLAVVDAIAASGYRERYRPRRWVTLAAAVAVTAIIAGIFVSQQPRAGVVERALRAVSGATPLQLTLVDPHPSEIVVDLSTGSEVAVPHVLTEWFEPRSGRRRVRDTVAGVTVSDRVLSGAANALDTRSALAAEFPVAYRKALARPGTRVEAAQVLGRRGYWLRFSRGALAAVAVDHRSYHPLLVVFHDGDGTTAFRVRSVLRVKALIPPTDVPQLRQPRLLETRTVATPPPALDVLRRDGLRPVQIKRLLFANNQTASDTIFAASRPRGRLPAHFLRVEIAPFPAAPFGWTPTLVALARPGVIVVERTGAYTVGYVRIRGSYLRLLTTERRQEIIQRARQLNAG